MNAPTEIVKFTLDQQLPATLDRVETAIALAKTPEDINGVLALMDAAVAYAKRFYKDQQDVIQRAKSLRLQAERRLGEILQAMPKATGTLKRGAVVPIENHGETTLADIGIDKKTSMRAQRLAALPEAKFEAVASGAIPIREVMRPVAKKKTAATRAHDSLIEQKVISATEGSTYLIASMRAACSAIQDATADMKEKEKTIAMARRLADAVTRFLEEFDGESLGQ